jgi:hypothetical protein
VERTQNLLFIIQGRSERLAHFLLLYINQLPTGVERTQNLLYIIQRRSARRAFSFVIYHSTACSGAYPKFSIYHPTPIGVTRACRLLYINQLPTGVERTQDLLPIFSSNSNKNII